MFTQIRNKFKKQESYCDGGSRLKPLLCHDLRPETGAGVSDDQIDDNLYNSEERTFYAPKEDKIEEIKEQFY